MKKRAFIAKRDKNGNIYHKDISAERDKEMERRFGKRWKQSLRKLSNEQISKRKAIEMSELDIPPEPCDMPLATDKIKI